jgi:SAM-dependent methyltransferase
MSLNVSTPITACRVCASPRLDPLLDLGMQPPANSLRKDAADPLPAVPLKLCRCADCGTVQLTETVDPAFLFCSYVWVTGTSRTSREYAAQFCRRLRQRLGRPGPLFVVEVASNDGTFLRRLQEAGDRVLGIDPAANIAAEAAAAGIPTWAEFFDERIADRVVREHGVADAAFARNVLPHVPDPLGILRGMAACVAEDGVVAVEFHQADAILDELHYDSIYHEHLFYHSLATMEQLLRRAGLTAFDLTTSPISGGSLVVYCAKHKRPASPELAARRARESAAGTNTLDRWQAFSRRSEEHARRLRATVDEAFAGGARIIGYGASARSSTLLNFCGIDHRHLLAIADHSPHKHGLLTPGTDVRILPPADALALAPDTVLLLAWNFRDEILDDLRQGGFRGRVIVPLPGDPVVLTI